VSKKLELCCCCLLFLSVCVGFLEILSRLHFHQTWNMNSYGAYYYRKMKARPRSDFIWRFLYTSFALSASNFPVHKGKLSLHTAFAISSKIQCCWLRTVTMYKLAGFPKKSAAVELSLYENCSIQYCTVALHAIVIRGRVIFIRWFFQCAKKVANRSRLQA